MAMSPSTLLAKLDELKKWQQTQQERLLKMHSTRLEEAEKHVRETSQENIIKSIENVNKTSNKASPLTIVRELSPEKCKKPKQPYLKRGTGLAKYGMNFGDHKRPSNKMKSTKSKPYKSAVHKRLAELRKQEMETCKSEIISAENLRTDNDITPLKVPEINIIPKSKWSEAFSECSPIYSQQCTPNNKSLLSEINEVSTINIQKADILQKQTFNDSNLMMILQKLASEKFGNCTMEQSDLLNKISFSESSLGNTPNKEDVIKYLQNLVEKQQEDTNFSSYEKALDRDLQIFEQLEEKVMHSSFCSTNSSVVDLLSSTPHRIVQPTQFDVIEEVQHEDSNCSNKSAKKSLVYESKHSSNHSCNSSVTSDDLVSCPATNDEEIDCVNVIIRQNACTMTDITEDEADLREKMAQLEKEISSFRLENRKLKRLKDECERQSRDLQKQKRLLEKKMEDERADMEHQLEEEKKKLHKERQVFEKYVKDNDKPNKKEREEITNLKCELESLKETLKIKETRNGTCQARLRNQIKSLEKENQNLKDEVEKLHRLNAKLNVAQHNNKKPNIETKMLHEISKNLSKLTKNSTDPIISPILPQEDHEKVPKSFQKSKNVKTKKSRKKISALEDNYAKVFHKKVESPPESDYEDDTQSLSSNNSSFREYSKYQNYKRSKSPRLSETQQENDKNSENMTATFRNFSDLTIDDNYNKLISNKQPGRPLKRHNSLNDTQQTVNKVEILQVDGSRETKYPNGNVKTISPDGSTIKMVYFNGDIKETRLLEGSIKYFYKESNVWQTTLDNGDETLEFPDGQIEMNFANGTSIVQYPNGITKEVDAEGTEKISYPDGSVATMQKNGDKILVLPNGQKEIHTESSKRREYPDGTVKIIYQDGLQETRYSNGRIRMKDKDGNLIMDSHRDD